MLRPWRPIVAFGITLLACTACRAQTADTGATQRLADLINRLGDEKPETRDLAEERLRLHGEFAEGALREAAKSPDGERVVRAKRLLGAIELRKNRRIAFLVRRGSGSVHVMDEDGSHECTILDPMSAALSSLDWSPDGTRIAVLASSDGLYIVNADGTGKITLDASCQSGSTPAWSPDGKFVALVEKSEDRSQEHLSLVDVHARKVVRITSSKNAIRDPAWSPDGKSIVFQHGDDELVVLDPVSRNQRTLWPDRPEKCYARWAPEGKRICFWSVAAELNPLGRLVVGDVETGKLVWLVEGGRGRWSPDGRRIAFERHESDNLTYHVWTVEADGKHPRRLTTKGTRNHEPSWSPDGTRILFLSNRDGKDAVYVMDADGQNQRRLFAGDHEVECPTWSPWQPLKPTK